MCRAKESKANNMNQIPFFHQNVVTFTLTDELGGIVHHQLSYAQECSDTATLEDVETQTTLFGAVVVGAQQ